MRTTIDPRDTFYILFGIVLIVILMSLADSADPALPNCPAHQTTSTRCAP